MTDLLTAASIGADLYHALELAGLKHVGNGEWRGPCPAHDGENPNSLKVQETPDGMPLVTCHSAGCDYQSIMTALGLANESPQYAKSEWDYQHEDGGTRTAYRTDYTGGGPCTFGKARGSACDRTEPHKHIWSSKGARKRTLARAFGDATGMAVVVEGEKTAEAVSAHRHYTGWTGIGGAKNLRHCNWEGLAMKDVILWPDNDTEGVAAMRDVATALKSIGAELRIVDVPAMTDPEKSDGRDAADLTLSQVGKMLSRSRKLTDSDFAKTQTKPKARNRRHEDEGLTADQRLMKRIAESERELRYNIETGFAEVKLEGEWHYLTDDDEFNIGTDLGIIRTAKLSSAIRQVAHLKPVEPRKAWLTHLASSWDWDEHGGHDDGEFQLQAADVLDDLFAVDYEQAPREVVRYASTLLFGGWIERELKPGAKIDSAPVLLGPEGIGKSLLFKHIVGEDRVYEHHGPPNALGAKELIENTKGVSILELQDMAAFNSWIDHVKGMLSKTEDNAREAYAKNSSHVRRRFAIAITSNNHQLIPPAQGNRRFAAVKLDAPKRNLKDTANYFKVRLDDIVAQCAKYVLDGHTFAMPADIIQANSENILRHFTAADDQWVNAIASADIIRKRCAMGEAIPAIDIFDEAKLHVDRERPPTMQSAKNRFSDALRKLGFEPAGRRRSPNHGNARLAYYNPPNEWVQTTN